MIDRPLVTRAAQPLCHFLSTFALAVVALAAPLTAGAQPADWRDVVIYQVMTDRFEDGDPSNNALEGSYDPSDGFRIHGGDFAGIEARLDYLEHLGVDAIWISPVVLNANAEYHGYAARDFFSIAPHLGGLPALQSMVQAAHARGIYVIIDVVTNHMGDLIDSGDGGYPSFKYPGTYDLRWRNPGKRHAGLFDDLAKFHPHGHVQNFVVPEEELGELFGLDDLDTADPVVRSELIAAATWLIDNTDCDGFRIDTVKHVEMPFWEVWAPAVRTHADTTGKSGFFLFGEVFDGSDFRNGQYTGTQNGGNEKLDATLYFPMYFTTNEVFRSATASDPPSKISDRYAGLVDYDPDSRDRLVSFLDNHDLARFMGFNGPADKDEAKLRAALGFHLTTRGVPIIYYGTEQSFDGGSDPFNREDMWDGQWDFGPSQGDNFDLASPLVDYVRSLTVARRSHEALRRGEFTERFAETTGPGLYVFQRIAAGDTVVVAVNTSNLPLERAQMVPWVAGEDLGDALDPGVTYPGVGGSIDLRVPARGVRVVESVSSRAAPRPDDRLRLVAMWPGHDTSVNDRHSPLTVVFDRDLEPASVPGAFQIDPPVAGSWQLDGCTARFYPTAAWSSGTTYEWAFDTTLAATDGTHPAARIDAFFESVTASQQVSVPAGFTVDLVARQGLAAPEALIRAPWIHPQALLLSDTGLGRLLTITPGGDHGHFLGDDRFVKAEGLVHDDGKPLRIVDESGVYEIDAVRMTGQKLGASGATLTGAGAWGGAAFADAFYMCDPQNDRVVRISPISTLQTFATGIAGGEGLAFGPGGSWSTNLYVADADLGAIAGSVDGPGRIVHVDAGGVVTSLVQDPLLEGASALAFDAAGAFGGDLFVADILGERILRVTPAGAVSIFASGFNNLSGSHCIAFGEDGALYVADPGSGQDFSNSGGNAPASVWRIAAAQLTLDAELPAIGAVRLAPPAPNPAAGRVTMGFTLSEPSATDLGVYDTAGRRVRTLSSGRLPAGHHPYTWDGADAAGVHVRPGVYFVRLVVDGRAYVRRIAMLR